MTQENNKANLPEILANVAKEVGVGFAEAVNIGKILQGLFPAPIEEINKLLADRVMYWRAKQLLNLCKKLANKFDEAGIHSTKQISPKLAIKILEEGSLEDDDSLQELWANLATNAMNPDFKEEVRYSFTDIIKSLTPLDVNLFIFIKKNSREFIEEQFEETTVANYKWLERETIIKGTNTAINGYRLSIFNLMRMQLVMPVQPGAILGGNYIDDRLIALTPFGDAFYKACTELKT